MVICHYCRGTINNITQPDIIDLYPDRNLRGESYYREKYCHLRCADGLGIAPKEVNYDYIDCRMCDDQHKRHLFPDDGVITGTSSFIVYFRIRLLLTMIGIITIPIATIEGDNTLYDKAHDGIVLTILVISMFIENFESEWVRLTLMRSILSEHQYKIIGTMIHCIVVTLSCIVSVGRLHSMDDYTLEIIRLISLIFASVISQFGGQLLLSIIWYTLKFMMVEVLYVPKFVNDGTKYDTTDNCFICMDNNGEMYKCATCADKCKFYWHKSCMRKYMSSPSVSKNVENVELKCSNCTKPYICTYIPKYRFKIDKFNIATVLYILPYLMLIGGVVSFWVLISIRMSEDGYITSVLTSIFYLLLGISSISVIVGIEYKAKWIYAFTTFVAPNAVYCNGFRTSKWTATVYILTRNLLYGMSVIAVCALNNLLTLTDMSRYLSIPPFVTLVIIIAGLVKIRYHKEDNEEVIQV